MKPISIVGLVLIGLGILAFVFPRINFTQKDTLIDLGPVELQAKNTKTVSIPDVAAGVAVGVGVILTIVGTTTRKT